MHQQEHQFCLQLRPGPAQREALEETFRAFAGATRTAMDIGRQADTTSNAIIHRLCYQQLRRAYDLSANLAVKAIAQAAAYLKEPPPALPSVIHYDARTLSVTHDGHAVSLSTVRGRLKAVALCLPTHISHRRLQRGHVIRGVLQRNDNNGYALDLTLRLPAFALPLHRVSQDRV